MISLIALAVAIATLASAAVGRSLWATMHEVGWHRRPQHHIDREFRRIVRRIGPLALHPDHD